MKGFTEIAAALRLLREPAVLATLVRTKGSSYRKPGARTLFRPGGPQTGTISAGCLEADLQARVDGVVATRVPALAAFDMTTDLDLVWGTRMGCQGKADVLLERVEPGVAPPWMEACVRILETRRPAALATVFAVQGAAVAGVAPGSRFLLEDGRLGGAPAGFESALRSALGRSLETGSPEECTLTSGEARLDVLAEPLLPPIALWVYGAGEHARPIFRMAKDLGWRLGLVDHRPALATAERFPEADRIVVGHPPGCLDALPLDPRTAALVVSHVYESDKAALARLLKAPLGYLGLQGNRRRSAKILAEIEAGEGPLDEAARAVLHVPAGLDLGAETPESIALSMVAEIHAALAGRGGGPLREGRGPIH